MLRKTHRLTKSQFDVFFRSGRRSHSPTLQLIYTSHKHFHGSVVVPKKLIKSAVGRNRLRRQLYSTLYETQKDSTGVYIVIIKKLAPISELRADLRKLVGAHT